MTPGELRWKGIAEARRAELMYVCGFSILMAVLFTVAFVAMWLELLRRGSC